MMGSTEDRINENVRRPRIDGFLTPFKVKQISTTLDEYAYTPDDMLIEGELETSKRYEEQDLNKIIEIKEREAHRVKLFLEQIGRNEKTLVFRATQAFLDFVLAQYVSVGVEEIGQGEAGAAAPAEISRDRRRHRRSGPAGRDRKGFCRVPEVSLSRNNNICNTSAA